VNKSPRLCFRINVGTRSRLVRGGFHHCTHEPLFLQGPLETIRVNFVGPQFVMELLCSVIHTGLCGIWCNITTTNTAEIFLYDTKSGKAFGQYCKEF